MSTSLVTAVKSAVNHALGIWYHHKQVTEATNILRVIGRRSNKTLNARDKRLCDEYAVEVLGHKHFAPWLYVYSVISGGFKEGWIPDNYYGSIVVPRLKGPYGSISYLKPLNTAIFESNAFPDLLSYANGIFFDSSYNYVPDDAVKRLLFRDHNRVIFKPDNSQQGTGIQIFDPDSFNVDRVKQLGNGLFQHFIEQHDLFAGFAHSSVATIRLTTVQENNGDVSVRAGYLRLGRDKETHVQSKSHIRVSLHLTTGKFYDTGYSPEWIETKVHPDSNIAFAGHTVPNFETCIETVISLHKRVPYVRCIGWDLTVDSLGRVQVLEWNADHNDIKFSEATQGPCFADLGWERLATGS